MKKKNTTSNTKQQQQQQHTFIVSNYDLALLDSQSKG